ncbi:MAG: hypothetical protein M1822_005926 [Bathelium mastoideum]|nr:MAG: hypothetical protein M1822_005926 [Bathelium mastoideum]
MADVKDVAYAAAMYTFQRTFGMCIGVAIGGAVFQNQLQVHLAKLQLPAAIAKNAEGFLQILKTLPKQGAEYRAFTQAYAQAFENVFEVLTGVAGLAGLLSLFIKEYTMDKGLGSDHVLKHGKKETVLSEIASSGMEHDIDVAQSEPRV